MRPQKIGLIALLAVLTTLTIDKVPLIQNPKSKIQHSQVLAQTPEARKAEANRLKQQGIEQAQTRQFEAAFQSWQQALVIYREIKDRQGEGRVLNNLGLGYYLLSDYAKAVDYHQQSLAIAKDVKDQEGEGKALGNLGNVYYYLGDYTKAIDYHRQHWAIAKEIKDREGEWKALGNLGDDYQALGDYTKAIDYYQQSLAIIREVPNRPDESGALGRLGNVYENLGDYTKAIDYHKQSLVIAKDIKDRQGEGAALNNLGNAHKALGDYPKAIDYHQQSLAILREVNDHQGEGAALGNLGVDYKNLGEYAKAIDYQQQRLAIAREIKDRQGEGTALGNLGIAYKALGDYTKAIDYQQQRLAIARAIKDRRGEGAALNNLGNAYNALGEYTKAIDYHQQSLAITKDIKDRQGEGAALGNLGNVYFYLGDYTKAIDYHRQNLAIAKRCCEAQIAREIKDRQGEGTALGNLGIAYNALGDYAKAIDYQQQSLVITKAIPDRDGEATALNNLGIALGNSGNLAEAQKTLMQGIQVNESLRAGVGSNDTNKVSIFEEQARTYRLLQKVLIAQNKTDAALEIAERGRARAFVELLARQLSTNPTEATTITPPTIEQIQQIAKAQNATLVQYSIIYDDFKVQGKEQSHESELYIWVIKPTGEVTFHRSDLKLLWQQQNSSLAQLVFNSRDSIGVRGLPIVGVVPRPGRQQNQEASLTQQLQQLHKLLIEPITDLLPTDPNAHVVFMPQGDLFLVPFPALKDKDGKYLIEKHTLLTAPSIQVLELTRQQRQRVGATYASPLQGNDALVVGNPTMPSVPPEPGQPPQQLPSLPGAEREALAIAPLLNTKPLIGNLATKSAIVQLLAGARIIHLATHGLLDDVRGLGSAIALTPSGNDDGLLTAEEILNLKLKAELVVLSACNTGRGRLTGDGVIGLSRSLISAGVPSVLVSLWSVPDAPTASLMSEFYQNLQNNPDKAQALRQAMLTTMKQHPNPKDWAAFTLIGEAE